MRFFNQKRLKDIAVLSVVVMAIQFVLSQFVYPFFKTTTQTLFAITPQTAITSPTIGNQVLGLLSGIFPFISLGGVLAIFIGTFVLLIVGYWIYDQKWAWKGKNIYQRLWAILLYGSMALYVFLLVTKIDSVSTLALPLVIGVAINYAAVAFLVSSAARYFKIIRV